MDNEATFKFKSILAEIHALNVQMQPDRIEQDYHELAEFISICREQDVRTVLEVGSRYGGTLRTWMKLLPTTHLVTVDKPWEEVTGTQELPELRAEREARWRSWLAPDQKLHCVWGNSHVPESLASVKNRMKDWGLTSFDMVFVDGDHRYSGVKADYQDYGTMATKLCGFNDFLSGFPIAKADCDVASFWNEMKAARKTQDIIYTSCYGIGVLWP